MKIHTKAVHAGDRKKAPSQIGVTTPIYTAASFITSSLAEQDRIYGAEEQGFAYQRYANPTNAALCYHSILPFHVHWIPIIS